MKNIKKKTNGFWAFITSKMCWVNVGVFVGVVLIVFLALKIYLNSYTHHGDELEMPGLVGLTMDQAVPILEERGLRFEVIDSVYNELQNRGEIIAQSPIAGSKVKGGRKVYLTKSTVNAPMVSMPQIAGMSGRRAKAELTSVGFENIVDEYVFGKYDNLALCTLNDGGDTIVSGTRLPITSKIKLVISKNDTTLFDSEQFPEEKIFQEEVVEEEHFF